MPPVPEVVNAESPILPEPVRGRLGRWLFPRGQRASAVAGFVIFLAIALPCVLTLPWSMSRYEAAAIPGVVDAQPPTLSQPMGTDSLGRSVLWRCLLGGAISLGIGVSASAVSVAIGVAWGALSGYAGGRTDALMMRTVDVLYGLPYILLVVLIDIALRPAMQSLAGRLMNIDAASGLVDVATLLVAIGGVSWLTLARVIRGQVLSLRAQPFIEAAGACGIGPARVLWAHVLPNLVGPIIVYSTLTIPNVILQESFLSFLGIGIRLPLPSWGNMASDGLGELHALNQPGMTFRWWPLVWPCVLLGATLMALNFLGNALRARLDPRSIRA